MEFEPKYKVTVTPFDGDTFVLLCSNFNVGDDYVGFDEVTDEDATFTTTLLAINHDAVEALSINEL